VLVTVIGPSIGRLCFIRPGSFRLAHVSWAPDGAPTSAEAANGDQAIE
jgi:hypothetical protein